MNNICPNCGGIAGQDCKLKTWDVVAVETIVHKYTVEAHTYEEAEEAALSGCPRPDADCTKDREGDFQIDEISEAAS